MWHFLKTHLQIQNYSIKNVLNDYKVGKYIRQIHLKKRITIQITNMIETKAEILNRTKMSCQKVYFTMNIKLAWNFMHQIILYHNTKSEICYKLREMDWSTILTRSFSNFLFLTADKCKSNFIPHKHRIYLYFQY